jgi:DNA invertase Pin-like site-specific DNA recombinase
MLTIEEIVKKLADRNLSEVARRTELSLPTVWRIANNQAGNTGYETVKKLSDYLEAQA